MAVYQSNQFTVTVTSAAWSYTGIPYPAARMGYDPITITEPADPANWPSAEQTGYYYIDPATGSDSGNTYGYPSSPRATIPSSVSLATNGGKMVLVGDGANYSASPSTITISGNGSVSDLNWVVGRYSTTKPVLIDVRVISDGTYTVHSDYDISGFTRGQQCFRMLGEYCTLRNYDFAGTGVNVGNTSATSCKSNSCFYNGITHDFGDWQAGSQNDYHGFKVAGLVDHIWLIEVGGYHLGGDTIQIGDDTGVFDVGPSFVYIAGGESYNNLENAVDIKTANDVVISGIYAHDFVPSASSGGTAVSTHYDQRRVWLINSVISDCYQGVANTSGATTFRVIGNVFSNIIGSLPNDHGFTVRGGDGKSIVAYNTFYNCNYPIDVDDPCMSFGNIFAARALPSGFDMWYLNDTDMNASVIDYNLFQDCRCDASSTYTSLAAWQAAGSGNQDPNAVEGDPLFTNAPAGDFSLQLGSPAIGAGIEPINPDTGVSIFDEFEAIHGVSLRYDINGNPRPSGSTGWTIGAHES